MTGAAAPVVHSIPVRVSFLSAIAVALLLGNAAARAHAEDKHQRADTAAGEYALALPDGQTFRLAPAFRPAAAAPAVKTDLPYAAEIDHAARMEGLDPALVHAVIHVESRHNAKAVSPKGAVGLMQLLPGTAARFGKRLQLTTVDDNLRAGTRYLSSLLELFDQRLDLALAAYNAGEGAVSRYGNRIPPYAETRQYVPAVMARYEEWKAPAVPAKPSYLPGTRLEAGWKVMVATQGDSGSAVALTVPANYATTF